MTFRNLLICKVNYIFNMMRLRVRSEQNDIMIFTTPRSGLTWLFEIFNTIPNTRCVREPLRPANMQIIERYMTPYMRYVDLSAERLSDMQSYFNDVLDNKILPSGLNPFKHNFKLKTDFNVLIISKACNLLPWFEQKFNCSIIYYVRHPISNSLSKLRLDWQKKVCPGRKVLVGNGLLMFFLKAKISVIIISIQI